MIEKYKWDQEADVKTRASELVNSINAEIFCQDHVKC